MAKNSNEDEPVFGVVSPATSPEVIPEPTIDDVPEAVKPPTMHDLQGVRYVGRADVRSITASDLALQGVDSPRGDLTFSADNDWFVPAADINAATRDWFALQTDEFVVE